jgi:hypothetical protein
VLDGCQALANIVAAARIYRGSIVSPHFLWLLGSSIDTITVLVVLMCFAAFEWLNIVT